MYHAGEDEGMLRCVSPLDDRMCDIGITFDAVNREFQSDFPGHDGLLSTSCEDAGTSSFTPLQGDGVADVDSLRSLSDEANNIKHVGHMNFGKSCRTFIVDDTSRFDFVGHLPVHCKPKQRCKRCGGYVRQKCFKCNCYFCVTKDRNCFVTFHTKE